MLAIIRPLTLFLVLFYLGFTSGTSSDDGVSEIPSRPAFLEPERLIPVLPVPPLLSSLLKLKPTSSPTNLVPATATTAPGGLPFIGSELPVPIIPLPVPTPLPLPVPLPVATSPPDLTGIPSIIDALTALLPSVSVPVVDIPPLLSELTGFIPEVTSDLAPVLPIISSLADMLSSQASGVLPAVGSLESMVSSRVAELTQDIETVASMVITELPVVSLELPSLTIPVSLPTSLVQKIPDLPLLSNLPLSDLPAKLSSIIGDAPGNAGLVGSIVGAILSTLDGVASNVIGEVTVVPGSILSMVTQEGCSRLVMTGGSMITISVPCSPSSPLTVQSSPVPVEFSSSSTASISSSLAMAFSTAMAPSSLNTSPSSASPSSSSSVGLSSATPVPAVVSNSFTTSSSSPGPTAPISTGRGSSTSSKTSSSLAVMSSRSSPLTQTVQTVPVPTINPPLTQPAKATTFVTTLTTVEISILTDCPVTDSVLCPSIKPCPLCPPPCSAETKTNPTAAPAAAGQGPCPGQGYTCEECLDGWFCPPAFTPAQPAPCGNGWPCYHCANGWFCVPLLTLPPATVTECPSLLPSSIGLTAPATQTPLLSNPVVTKSTLTITSTAVVTVSTVSVSSQESLHLPVAGWQYGGCYKEVPSRGLKNASITAPNNAMTVNQCIVFCSSNGFGLAGTENGYMCFCGDVLVDSWPIDDTECDIPCSGDSGFGCGGAAALSIWSPDRNVPREFGPEHEFIMPVPTPGQTEMAVNFGFVRHTVIRITTLVDEWPAGPSPVVPKMSSKSTTPGAGDGSYVRKQNAAQQLDQTSIDIEGIASTVHAIVSAAMEQAQQIAAAEVAKANSIIASAKSVVGMGFENMAGQLNSVVGDKFPQRVAWTTCSTTVTSCSSTTTIGTTTTCTRSGFVTTTPNQASGVAPVSPPRGTSSSVSTPRPENSGGPVPSPGASNSNVTPSLPSDTSTPVGTAGVAPIQQSTVTKPPSGTGTSTGTPTPSTLSPSGFASVQPVGQSSGPGSGLPPLTPSPSASVTPTAGAGPFSQSPPPPPPAPTFVSAPAPASSTTPVGTTGVAPIQNGPSTTPSSLSSPSTQSISLSISSSPMMPPQSQPQTFMSDTTPNVSPLGTVGTAPASTQHSTTTSSPITPPTITMAPEPNQPMDTYFAVLVSGAGGTAQKEARSFTA